MRPRAESIQVLMLRRGAGLRDQCGAAFPGLAPSAVSLTGARLADLCRVMIGELSVS